MRLVRRAQPLLQNRLEIHDRKQFEIKLEYQPSGADSVSKYRIECFLFLPLSLNVDQDTYPRTDFYADLHNYVRLKTPVLSFDELLTGAHSPLVKLEAALLGPAPQETELVYQGKMLSCVFRGALRRFAESIAEQCSLKDRIVEASALQALLGKSVDNVREVLKRFRELSTKLVLTFRLSEHTAASLRLIDEYLSLSVEQNFRRAVAEMDRVPRTGAYIEIRKALMDQVIAEESYRIENRLRSVISPGGDNEEYVHRLSMLKKYCMNILFLSVLRQQRSTGVEEVLFALAAGVAMTFATAVAFAAQQRFPQASLNFFLILVVGYMMKDRIKDGLRRIFVSAASRRLFDRSTRIVDPVTQEVLGVCKEKVDYGRSVVVPEELMKLRATDDLSTVSRAELPEMVIRYQKQITLESERLPRMGRGIASGVTDIMRFNIERFLRDMDDPEAAIEYVDVENFSIGRVKGAKSYQVDLAVRMMVEDGDVRTTHLEAVRLVLDKNGIKRMVHLTP